MALIDTHAHLFLETFKADIEAVVQRARQNGIIRIIAPNIDATTLHPLHQLCTAYPDIILPAIGLHPCSVNDHWQQTLQKIQDATRLFDRIVAIGECGLDFYRNSAQRTQQEQALEAQLHWAQQTGLPVILHTRESTKRTLEIIRPYAINGLRGVFHCFTGDKTDAHHILDLGFYIGVGGIITFKNAHHLKDTIRKVPLSAIVLETDAPFLAPVPHRGKRNESSYLTHIRDALAHIKSISPQEVEEITTQNAMKLFRLEAAGGFEPP